MIPIVSRKTLSFELSWRGGESKMLGHFFKEHFSNKGFDLHTIPTRRLDISTVNRSKSGYLYGLAVLKIYGETQRKEET